MPTTYTPLATTTLNSNAGTVTLSGISGSYTDLVLVMNIIGNAAQEIYFRVNGDTGSNYSGTRLSGNGTTATSARASNQSVGFISGIATTSTTNPNFNSITHFQNYSNTTTFKTVLSRASNANAGTEGFVSTWRNTAAITSIEISSSTSSFASGSTFSLYGIASAAVVSGAKATGGDTIATDGTYWYHAFRTSGTFTPTQSLTADILVVAGGGGSSQHQGGGGGAGGLLAHTAQNLSTTNYTITIGAGGTGVTGGAPGGNGGASQFGSITSCVGGGGGGMIMGNGQNGGSGGGGGGFNTGDSSVSSGGTATAGQGNNGGTGTGSNGATTGWRGGGGGGAGSVGGNAAAASGAGQSGNGGSGVNTYSSWVNITGVGVSGFIAGGGAGGGNSGGGTGGSGGGGNGGGTSTSGTSGATNTGSGAGGAGNGTVAANGGSGIIIVRYPV